MAGNWRLARWHVSLGRPQMLQKRHVASCTSVRFSAHKLLFTILTVFCRWHEIQSVNSILRVSYTRGTTKHCPSCSVTLESHKSHKYITSDALVFAWRYSTRWCFLPSFAQATIPWVPMHKNKKHRGDSSFVLNPAMSRFLKCASCLLCSGTPCK